MVSWYLTFALTEYYRYTKTFGLSHLNLSFLFVLYCLKDAFSSKEMTSLGQPENFWVSPVLTSFDQLWERAANNATDSLTQRVLISQGSLTQPQRCNEQLTISWGSIILTFVWRLSLMILKTLGLTTSISSWGLNSIPSIWSCLASPFNALANSPWRTQKLS